MHIDITASTGPSFNMVIKKNEEAKWDIGFFKIVVEAPKIATIYYMYIKPKYRNQGYATQFLNGLKEDFDKISTQINASTNESVSFLKKQGFEPTGNWLVWTK